jgi:hypothetical protein
MRASPPTSIALRPQCGPLQRFYRNCAGLAECLTLRAGLDC